MDIFWESKIAALTKKCTQAYCHGKSACPASNIAYIFGGLFP